MHKKSCITTKVTFKEFCWSLFQLVLLTRTNGFEFQLIIYLKWHSNRAVPLLKFEVAAVRPAEKKAGRTADFEVACGIIER